MSRTKLSFEITVNGGPKQLPKTLGLVPRALQERNAETSTLTLTQSRTLRQPMALQRQDYVRLFLNDVCVFAGRVADPTHSYSGTQIQTTFRVHNWWRSLERLTWTHCPVLYVADGDTFSTPEGPRLCGPYDNPTTDPPTLSNTRLISAKTNLFSRFGFWLEPQNTSIQLMLDGLFLYITQRHPDLLLAPEVDFGDAYFPQPRIVTDISVADAIKQTIVLAPGASFYTDYNSDIPQVYCVNSPDLEARVFALGERPLQGMEITAQNDMVPSSVCVRVGNQSWRFEYWPGFQDIVGIAKWPGDVRQDALDVMSLSVDNTSTEDVLANPGFAQAMYNELAIVRGRGSLSFADPGLSLGLKCGQKIEVTGDDGIQHGAMIIQEVSHDFSRAQTTCSVGYPRALGLEELKDRNGLLHRGYWGNMIKRERIPGYSPF